IEKNRSSSKKLVLSLVTISFLSSYSYANNTNVKAYSGANSKSRSASVYSSQSRINTTINQSLSNTQTITDTGNTLVIGSSGTIQVSNNNHIAVDFKPSSSTDIFKNEGTIQGGSDKTSVQVGANGNSGGGATINTFTNEGIIGNGTSQFGITVWGKDDFKSTINNFSNKGIINSNVGEAIYLGNTEVKTFTNSGTISSNGGYGINIATGTSIENFNNNGTIKGENNAINIAKNSKIQTFNNTGFIQSNSSYGVINISSGSIQTFINDGTIKSTGTFQPSGDIEVSSGMYLEYSSINSFINNGFISGIMGINLLQATINTFINKGTIQSTCNNNVGAAINLMTSYGHASVIDNLTNEGILKSSSNGILAEIGNKINTLTNKGTIEASLNGISFYDYDSASGSEMKLGKIILENDSSIKAGNNGINIDNIINNRPFKPIKVEAIEVKKGAKI
ncbi:TPA: hypothetical protein R1794_001700, partial [Campylobacter jejuni]|nr:hypothetical protein [Campylobacter jejuni]